MKTNSNSPAQNPSLLDRPEDRISYDIGGDGPLVVLVPGTYTKKTAVLVGLCFLAATFTFAIGNALISFVLFERARVQCPHRRGDPSGLLRPLGRCKR